MVASIIMAGLIIGCATTTSQMAAWTNPLPPSPDVIEHGMRVYKNHCQVCHGENHDGYGPNATQLEQRPTDLRFGYNDSSQLYEHITRGRGEMPSFDRSLSVTDRAATIWYLQTLPGNRPKLAANVPDRVR